MSAHTPGPWVVESPDAGELVVVAASGTDDAEDLAVMDSRVAVHPNALANANLIAAAPELLAVVRRWIRVMGKAAAESCGCSPAESYVCCACEVRAAIAKAEGKVP